VPERRQRRDVLVEYCFDRLWGAKLELVYDLLVPDRSRRTGISSQAGVSAGPEPSPDDGEAAVFVLPSELNLLEAPARPPEAPRLSHVLMVQPSRAVASRCGVPRRFLELTPHPHWALPVIRAVRGTTATMPK
jgi:hypothetical protein